MKTWCRQIQCVSWAPERSVRAKLRAALAPLPYGAVEVHGPMVSTVLEAVRRAPADLVHIQGIELLACVSAVQGRVPLVFDMVDCTSLQYRRRAQQAHQLAHRAWYWWQAKQCRLAERRLMSLPLRLLLCSPVDVAALPSVPRHPNMRVHVVPHGVEVAPNVKAPPASGPPRLVFTGNMAYLPNDDAVRYFCRQIWPRVRRAVPDATFEAIGKHPSNSLVAFCRRIAGVHVIAQEFGLREAMVQRTLFVSPLRIGSGVKFKMLDAMAGRMAIVASPVSVEGLLAEDGRHLMIAKSPGEFAQKIVQALASPELRARLGAQALQLVKERYAWSSIGSELDRIYQAAARAPQ